MQALQAVNVLVICEVEAPFGFGNSQQTGCEEEYDFALLPTGDSQFPHSACGQDEYGDVGCDIDECVDDLT